MVSYSYDAWGNIISKFFFKYGLANAKKPYTVTLNGTTYTAQDIDLLNGFYYRGYYLDKETKLYYLITRYYDPEVGRFISADDPKYLDFLVAYGHNRYAYCNNNPVMGYDPEGNFWFHFIATIVGVGIGAISGVVTEVIRQQQSGEDLNWNKIGKAAISGGVSGGVTALVTVSTGSVAAGSYAGAAAGALTEEIYEYATGEKELTTENVISSIAEVCIDTAVDGTINYVSNKIAANVPDIKINPGWFKPQKFKSFFTKPYGQKTSQQICISGIIGSGLSILKEGLYVGLIEAINHTQKMFG